MQSLKLSEIVINWYKKNLRKLPWRPKNFNQKIDPYIVFLSEFMLQQTTVKTVVPYFINFLKKYPTIEILAKAKLDDVLAIWSGLGYYRRANNLYKSSKIIINELNGVIPNNYEDLIKLPGIGDYTAAAICAIAFDKKVVVIDGNIERVISRLFELDLRGNDLKKKVREILFLNIPGEENSLFTQGLMDIGATICKPKIINCERCPLSENCRVAFKNSAINYPLKIIKEKKIKRTGNFYCLINCKKEILFLRNINLGLFENMHVLPSDGWLKDNHNLDFNIFSINERFDCGVIKHSFTHFDLDSKVILLKVDDNQIKLKDNCIFIKPENLDMFSIPTLYHKIVKLVLKNI